MVNSIQESINNAIKIIVEKRINALDLDKTVIGVIDSVVNSVDGIYKIKYDGGYFNAESQPGASFPKGMSVYVQIPQNDMTKKKLIIGRASDLRESEHADVIISNLNNYAIVGNSVVIPKDESIGEGIRSYCDETKKDDPFHPMDHWAKLIYSNTKELNTHYKINTDALELYKQNATALMVQAEFRTSLDVDQRYNGAGIYGIGLNLSFENSNYQYGSTQKEMFDYFSSQIQADIERYDDVTQTEINTTISMQDIDRDVQNAINDKDKTHEELTADDGDLDKNIAYANSLLTAYAAAASAVYLPEEDAIMQSYLALLSDLKNLFSTKKEIQDRYKQWQETKIEKPEKQVSYVLDSNNMTGNPFLFTSWSTQYAIFNIDFENFKSIDSILFYKQGFNHSAEKEKDREEDIFIRNLKIYALQPISAINGDYRLELQTPNGLIFESLSEEEKLDITGKVTKAYYEDLSNNATYYWFKKNPNVTTVTHTLYHQCGGIGWEYIGGPDKKGNSKTILSYGNENTAYKNKYKCVCLIDDTILLKEEFTLYNNAAGTDIEINSDLGQVFSFDAGAPTLTCLLKLKGPEETYQEYLDEDNKYQYIWSVTINNITTSFEYNYLHQLESIQWDESVGTYIQKSQSAIPSIAEAMQGSSEGNIINIIQNVQFFKGDELITLEENIPQATRIKYPISNLVNESVITFTCSVVEKKGDTTINLGEATIDLQNQGHPQISSYRLILENGDQIFQYDEYGNPPNSPKLKSPQEIKPIIPHLLNPAGIEVSNKNYKVQWTLPIENTLIVSSATLGLNPFDNGKTSLDSNPQCVFTIAESYNEDNLNNQILCRVTLNDEIIQATTDFYFGKVGSNGTNGTDMVAKIVPTQNKQILNTQPVILYRYNDGKDVIFNTGTKNVFLANSDSSQTRIFEAKLYQKNKEIESNNFTVKWNIAGNPQITSNKIGRYIKLVSTASGLTWHSSLQWDETVNTDKLPIYILRAQITYQNKDYYAFYSLPVIYYNSTKIPKYNRIAINKSTLLKEVVYNADGRNPIYNHNQGIELLNIPKNSYIIWTALGGSTKSDRVINNFLLLKNRNDTRKDASDSIIPNSIKDSQNFIYILPNDNFNGSSTDNRVVAYIYNTNINKKIADTIKNYNLEMLWNNIIQKTEWNPTKKQSSKNEENISKKDENSNWDKWKKEMDKISDDKFASLTDKIDYWLTELIKDYEAKIATVESEALIAAVTIPIHMSLNTFGLASLNAWDGNTVTIDEDNGYVMAPQVGAGEKDSNNRFTGILMGKTETYTGSSSNEIETGLFGYAHGIQSIFLDANTGNAIFGLPDGKILDKTGNIPIPKNGDNYNEGRIELVPGGESKIGGWRLGHQSLYYTSSGEIGNKYSKDYVPTVDGKISSGNSYHSHHIKDIKENDSGVLIHAGENPYISVKGRKLYPTSSDKGILSENADSYILDGDSLEMQLDPKTPTLFTIFRHNGTERKKANGKTLYPVNSRTFLAGINSKGQLMANGLQSTTNTGSGGEQITTFGVDTVPAFGYIKETSIYTGLQLSVGDNNIAKLFVKNDNNKNSSLYISGSTTKDSEYERPISIHGNTISLYAKDSNNSTTDHDLTQKSKILISSSQFYGGNEDTSHIYLPSSGSANITTVGSNTIKGSSLALETTSGNIGLNTRVDDENENTYLRLFANGHANLRGALSGYFVANNGNINIKAKVDGKDDSGSSLTLKNSGDSTLETAGKLTIATRRDSLNLDPHTEYIVTAGTNIGIFGGGTGTGTATGNKDNDRPQSNQGIYMPSASVNTNAFFRVVRPLDIESTMRMTIESGGAISIKTTGTQTNNIINIENTKYKPDKNGSNIINVSTTVGGFAIQRNIESHSGRKCDSVLTLSNTSGKVTGFIAPYGYFTSNYDGNNSIYASKNIYAVGDVNANRYTVRSGRAHGYGFDADQTISSGGFSASGGSVGALLQAILQELNRYSGEVQRTVDAIKADLANHGQRIGELDTNLTNLQSSVSNHISRFDRHYHNITDKADTRLTVVGSISVSEGKVTGWSPAHLAYVRDFDTSTTVPRIKA